LAGTSCCIFAPATPRGFFFVRKSQEFPRIGGYNRGTEKDLLKTEKQRHRVFCSIDFSLLGARDLSRGTGRMKTGGFPQIFGEKDADSRGCEIELG
jgi:hypothetical protein